MNKPKSQRITPATMTGEQIADAIMYGTYTKTALWSFISRNGGADAAHAKYPQLAVALHILKQERKKAKSARAVKAILKPLSRQFADGQSMTEILAPVLQSYRRLYREKFNLDMTPEQVIMFLVATHGVETLENTVIALLPGSRQPDRSGATPSQSNRLKKWQTKSNAGHQGRRILIAIRDSRIKSACLTTGDLNHEYLIPG
jgi:hypothetical protein